MTVSPIVFMNIKSLQFIWMLILWPFPIVYFTLISIPFLLMTLVSRNVADAMMAPGIYVIDLWSAGARWIDGKSCKSAGGK